jgi:MFS family permease
MGFISGIAALILVFVSGGPDTLMVQALIGLWGAGALSFYGLCVAHAADRCEPEKISRMMSGLLFVWATGSVIGPMVFGAVMTSHLVHKDFSSWRQLLASSSPSSWSGVVRQMPPWRMKNANPMSLFYRPRLPFRRSIREPIFRPRRTDRGRRLLIVPPGKCCACSSYKIRTKLAWMH